jgi:homoserine dehydrogenase
VLFDRQLQFSEMTVQGISHLSDADIDAARAAGERWKLIAKATPDGGEVGAVRLPLSDPLAGVGGATNAITLQTDLLGAVTLVGPGAGRLETGFAILADVLNVNEST